MSRFFKTPKTMYISHHSYTYMMIIITSLLGLIFLSVFLLITCYRSANDNEAPPPPPLPTRPAPTTLPPPTTRPGCMYGGRYYPPGADISRGSDPPSGMCWWVKCDGEGNVVTGDFRCLWKDLSAHMFFKDEQQE